MSSLRYDTNTRAEGATMIIGQTLLERYTVTELVGEGGMGIVYRALDSAGNAVAIKRLHADIAATPGLIARFEREATAHALLAHPHIAGLYAVAATEEHELFFVMELVEGPSLAHVLRLGSIPQAETLAITRQILSALHHAHQLGIVHRDLKPENVLLDERAGARAVKLIDFGLVKMLENVLGPAECERLTTTGMVFGTPAYMPPEQILGHGVDARTDLYSLGIMLFEMLAGRLPFDSDEVSELWDMHLHAPIPSLRPHAPDDLDAIVSTLLAKAPPERFASALAVLRALEAASA
jgi:eukaryotic-like serine/threonine-protein kinase